MRVQTIVMFAVSGIFLVSGTGIFGAESSSSSAVPTLEVLSIDPPSPAVLEAGQKVIVKVRYDMADCESIQIQVRPSGGTRNGFFPDGTILYRASARAGTAEGYFYFDDKAEVKEIRVLLRDVKNKSYVYEITKAVEYRWLRPAAPKPPVKFEGTTRIPASFKWDIDSDTINGISIYDDLWWNQYQAGGTGLNARNGTGMAILEIPFDQINLDRLKKCSMGQKSISTATRNNWLKPGLCLGLKTTEGRLAKLELLSEGFPHTLTFRWQLYPEIVNPKPESVNRARLELVKQYEGLWYYSDPWGFPDDRVVVLDGRINKRGELSFDLVKHFSVSKPVFGEAAIRKDQIEIRFNEVQYADQKSADKTMSYSLLYHEGDLLGQVFRDGLEPEKIVMRRLDATMTHQVISFLAGESRDLQLRLERQQAEAAREKSALKNQIDALEKDNGQLRSENAEQSNLVDRARKEIEDITASWDRAKEQIADLQRELAEVRQANRELTDQKQKVLKTVQALEDMLRQARVTKQD